MVSFFRKKKKSAQGKKGEGGKADSQGSPTPNQPAARSGGTATEAVPTPAAPSRSTTGNAEPKAVGKRSASYPTKKRNFLGGSLKGSRSSVSRLPAVEEEKNTPVTGTPDTAAPTSPEFLDNLSFDNQEGQVEILTPSSKEEVKRQLDFQTPPRGSRVASMEVSPDGIVTQISQDEDADILLDTSTSVESPAREMMDQADSGGSAPTDSAMPRNQSVGMSPHHVVRTPRRLLVEGATTTLVPPSPISVATDTEKAEREQEPLQNDESLVVDGGPDAKHRDNIAGTSTAATNVSMEAPENTGRVVIDVLAESGTFASFDEVPDSKKDVPTQSLAEFEKRAVSPSRDPTELQSHTDGRGWKKDEMAKPVSDSTVAKRTSAESHTSRNDWNDENSPLRKMEKKLTQVAQSLMSSLQLTSPPLEKEAQVPLAAESDERNISMFYDEMCKPADLVNNPRRPFFDEDFAQRFVDRMLSSGLSLLYLQPPGTTSNPSEDWKGRTVVMKIVPGSTGDQEAIQPRLQWTTMPGGTVHKAYMTSLSLLRIHSVMTASKNLIPEDSTTADLDEDDLCFVSVTSASGKVFLFEANSVKERDEIAHGLRNIIARLSFHLISGDQQASTELYNDDRAIQEEAEPGDLPALASPKLNMNRMTHLLLEV